MTPFPLSGMLDPFFGGWGTPCTRVLRRPSFEGVYRLLVVNECFAVPAEVAKHIPDVGQGACEIALVAVGFFLGQVSEKSGCLLVGGKGLAVAAEIVERTGELC